ncbi:bifunctional serine/threonine-protein kinase/ABC transporter substrate-binding protein [Streptomyces sp. LZ34]
MIPLRSGDPARIGGYRLLARLGAGGMGVVYLARSPGGALLALKVIQAEYAHDPQFRTRFHREVTAARRINTPWAATVPDADTNSDTPWLATTYIPGPSLTEAITTHGPLPHTTTHTLATTLAQALHAIHQAGLIHRDVKPANILLAPDGPRLIDFGIARALDDTAITATDMVIGSPGFLSPEQAQAHGAVIGPPSDIFSLGCVLAYATTGRPPFGTGAPAAVLFRTVHDAVPLDGVPDQLRPLVEACLDKDPGRRPTAADLARELARDVPPEGDGWLPEPVVHLIAERSAALVGLPGVEATEADPAGEPGKAPARPGRRRLLAASGAVVLAGGGLAAWAAWGRDAKGAEKAPGLPRRTVALHADLSGGAAAAGRAQARGAQLAVEEFNAREDRPFELVLKVFDDGGRPDVAKAVAKKLTADRSVLAVIGPTTDETAETAVAVYDEAKLPMLAVSVRTFPPAVAYRSALLARPEYIWQGYPLGLRLRQTLHSRRIGLIEDRKGDDYSQRLALTFARLMQSAQYEIVPKVVRAGTDDFGPAVSYLMGEKVAAVVFAGFWESAAKVARELDGAGFRGPRYATEPVVDPRFVARAGQAAEGWTCTATFVDPAAKPSAAGFMTAYRRRFKAAPERYAAEAYDAGRLLARSIRTAGGRAPARASVLSQLLKTDYQGITKKFTFSAEDRSFEHTKGTLFLYRVQGGRFRFLGDAPYEDG